MKQDWKPDELRATSEEIRGAVMPKSITPEMVGGTLVGLVDAVGEIVETLGEIPREHVRVRVRGCDCDGLVAIDGATVEIEAFSVLGFPVCRPIKQTVAVDENGEVSFDVPHGFTFSVVAKCPGMGASFQLVQDATRESRLITLWCFPVGIFWYGQVGIATEKYFGPSYPIIMDHYDRDGDVDWSWVSDDIAGNGEWWTDEFLWRGILVSTADTAFVIMPNNLSEGNMMWSDTYGFGLEIPFCANFNPDDMMAAEGEDPWELARDKAMLDFDGYMNTAKILKHCTNPIAAKCAAAQTATELDQHNFLPSAGQLYVMWLNRTAINAIMTEANDEGWEFKLLPYANDKGQWQNPNGRYEYWWSSTQAGPNCSWVVRCNGNVNYTRRNDTYDVRAVSAFHFEY